MTRSSTGCTVADVLADPERFVGATLADPNEGPDDGRCVAKILRRSDGTLFIHSFAHGRTIYRSEARRRRGARQRSKRADKASGGQDASSSLPSLADLDEQELEELRDLAPPAVAPANGWSLPCSRRHERSTPRGRPNRSASAAPPSAPTHGRRFITQPIDAPWLPQMEVLNEVLGSSPDKKPPARNIDDDITRARKLRVPNTHAFTNANADPEEK